MAGRIFPLVNDEIYHVCTKSIAGFKIFKCEDEYQRMRGLLKYHALSDVNLRFSDFIKISDKNNILHKLHGAKNRLVEILAYCIMPTHLHLILKQLKNNGISVFMNKVLNSYTKYFNFRVNRKGPLWESRFKNVLIGNDGQLLHLTRYIHLNPVTARIVPKLEDWKYSSYKEYLGKVSDEESICNFRNAIEIDPREYKKFVESRIDYQRELAVIKAMCLE